MKLNSLNPVASPLLQCVLYSAAPGCALCVFSVRNEVKRSVWTVLTLSSAQVPVLSVTLSLSVSLALCVYVCVCLSDARAVVGR